MTGSSRELVALFKSADEKASIDDRYFSMLEENNFSGILVPTLSFQFQLSNLKECLFQPEKYSGIILTSQRSVESVNQAASDLPDAWKNKPHYCVGKKTGETASKLLGLTHQLIGQDCGNAESLSALIVKDFQDGSLSLPLLFPCSNLKMDTLPRTLKEHNISVDIVTSYVTVPHPQLRDSIIQLAHKVPNYLVFFSPSGVNYTLPLLRDHNLITGVKVVSIGNTTARALEDAGICVNRVCVKPTPEDLMEALKH